MGGERSFQVPRVSRAQILDAYKAGPDAVVSLIEYLQEQNQSTIEQLLEIIDGLRARIESLEQKSTTDSHNSNKPPSSDGFHKRIHSRRQPSGKRPGGQKGHEGTTLAMVKHPDSIEVHSLCRCGHCGNSLKNQKVKGYQKRQVFDIPPVRVEVHEHQAEIKRCPRCGRLTTAEFPEGVRHKTQYGNRVNAWASYLKDYVLLPYERLSELFYDLFGLGISTGTLAKIDQRCSKGLGETVQSIKKALLRAPVIQCDETGIRINGKLHWLHTAGTEDLTYYAWHARRGNAATDEIGILPEYHGIAVHDHWKSYFLYKCRHALCNAHHLRELEFVIEQFNQCWAQKMVNLLLYSKELVEKAKAVGQKQIARSERSKIEQWYEQLVAEGLTANPPPPNSPQQGKPGRLKRSKPANLVERLRDRRRETLRFVHDFRVPFENNLAERDLRMMKVQQKISGTFRSTEGASAFCRIRSYISTVKKQGISVIDALSSVFDGRPLLPPTLQRS
jgi:transposase